MFRLIGILIVFVGLLLSAGQTAFAHSQAHRHYDAPRHFRVTVIRDNAMPRWLRHEKGFRSWYRYSALRHNRHLQWWQLYEIYCWERRLDRRRHHTAYYRHQTYDWYQRYWRDLDRDYAGHGRGHYRNDRRRDDDRRRHRH